jgi:hypothetical protein
MRTFHDSADQSWVHQGRIRTAIRRAWGWINRRAFTQTNCAWCQPPKVMHRAWITARLTSHTICPACREAMLRDATIFNA